MNQVQQTLDGGYILAGGTQCQSIYLPSNNDDAWLIKTDSEGHLIWSRVICGERMEVVYSVQPTSDGGYILAANIRNYGDPYNDAWLIKTDSDGRELWNTTFGEGTESLVYSVQPTSDGGYILAGERASESGFMDAWLIKTDSTGREAWSTTFGGMDMDCAKSVKQTSDCGYVIAGTTESIFGLGIDGWLIKTDSSGREMWKMTFSNTSSESSDSVHPTFDGAYVLAGTTLNESRTPRTPG